MISSITVGAAAAFARARPRRSRTAASLSSKDAPGARPASSSAERSGSDAREAARAAARICAASWSFSLSASMNSCRFLFTLLAFIFFTFWFFPARTTSAPARGRRAGSRRRYPRRGGRGAEREPRGASRDTRGEHRGRAGACGSTESLRAGGAGTGDGQSRVLDARAPRPEDARLPNYLTWTKVSAAVEKYQAIDREPARARRFSRGARAHLACLQTGDEPFGRNGRAKSAACASSSAGERRGRERAALFA